MQSKKRGAKAKKRKRKPKAGADKRERLKPVSLHPLEFDEAMRRLVMLETIMEKPREP